jgi:polysaccharide biosynthesis/export protein
MRQFLITFVALGLTLPLAAQPPADGAVTAALVPLTSPRPRSPVATGIVLGPGDVVRITVWRKPEFSGEFRIAPDGSIAHPLYRAVEVAGVPFSITEERVGAFLRHFGEDPQFVIEPLLRVSVGGEVGRPNLYTLNPETSIAQAVALAGGPTERGRRDRVLVVRSEGALIVRLTDAASGGLRMPIRSGDQIIVERRRTLFRDYIAPAITLTGATAAIISVILRSQSSNGR